MPSTQRPWMDADLELFESAVAKVYEKEIAPHAERWRKQHMVDRSCWTSAGENGLLCASIPEEYGGSGGTFAHEAIITEQNFASGGVNFGNEVHSTIVAHYLLAFGSEEQKQQWLPKMATGEVVTAIAMTEPGTGSDLQAVKTSAVKDGDDYIINGSKTFITNGQHADLVVLVAKTDPDKGAAGTSLILVEASREGFEKGRNLDKIGQQENDTSELFFNNVRVPQSNLLGKQEGMGFIQLMQQLAQERLILGVGAVACMFKALEVTLDYTRQRKAFGRKVFDFQNTRFKLAECKTKATVTRAFIDECIVEHLQGKLTVERAAMAKYWATDMQCEVVDECLQLHGGYGYMNEYPIARMYADSRVQKIYGGTNEIMKELISRSL